MDYTWKTHDNTCRNDHDPIMLENHNPKLNYKIPCWSLHKANWVEFENLCQSRLISEANINNEENMFYFISISSL